MTLGYLLVAAGYAVLAATVFLFESYRTRQTGIDVTTMFVAVCMVQCCLPAIAIYALLPFVNSRSPTGVEFVDRILQSSDPATAALVLCLTIWFVLFFYVGCGVGRLALSRRSGVGARPSQFVVSISNGRLFALLLAGLGLSLLSFYLLGDSMLARYTGLILFRNNFEGIERNALNANAFALTQSWSWLAVLAIFAAFEQRGRGWLWLLCLLLTLVFALLGVSRRALFLPLLMSYLALVLHDGRWRIRWLLLAVVPLVLLLAYGKTAFAALAYGGTVGTVVESYQSWASVLLRTASDAGLTTVESLGTLRFLDLDMRFGVDHLLSIAQRFPEGMLGLDFNFPERVVRISTEAFADSYAQDIPPGLFGQMWLDFRIAGPVIWGGVFGLQMSVIQFLFERTDRTLQSAAVFVLLVFVLALPLNTGSFDFSFSVDIFAFLLGLWLCVRFRPQRANGVA